MKNKSDSYWRKKLTKEQYRILRKKGTELPFAGKLLKNKEKGMYVCAGCGNELFSSETKFDSHCGWPSFFEGMKDRIEYARDDSNFMRRIEVRCRKCGGHLGHVFNDGPREKTGNRYCINSCALAFEKSGKKGK